MGAGPAAPPAPAMMSLVQTSTRISRIPILAQQETQVGCETLLASGVQAGTDCQPSRCCAALSDSESARLGSGTARQLFTGILDHDLFRCSCKLELIVEPPASTGGRQVGLERKPRSARASWAEAEFETQPGNFPRLELVLFLVDKPQST